MPEGDSGLPDPHEQESETLKAERGQAADIEALEEMIWLEADAVTTLLANAIAARAIAAGWRAPASALSSGNGEAVMTTPHPQPGREETADAALRPRAHTEEETLELTREALVETMKRVGSGYDWNADPDGMTLKQGEVLAAIDEQAEFARDCDAAFAQTPEQAESESVRRAMRQLISADLLRRDSLLGLVARAAGLRVEGIADKSPMAAEVDAYLARLAPYSAEEPPHA